MAAAERVRAEAWDAAAPPRVLLVCADEDCGTKWEPSYQEIAEGQTGCPKCSGWTFVASLADAGEF